MGNRQSGPTPAPNIVDWPAIRLLSRPFTFEELSYYSRSGINPYTTEFVRTLCSQFTIPARAKKDLAATRENLSIITDKGTRHVLLDLTASDHGLIVLGICGILNETFRQEALAIVFHALASSTPVPDDLTPLYHSWAELNELCGQLQLPHTFHALVEKHSRLENSATEGPDKTQTAALECAGSLLVVQGLQTMSRVCSGEEEGPILVLAGHHAGWYAAVAEWMFELKIQITAPDGRVVYTNCEGHEELMQMTVAFHNRGVPCDGSEPVEDLPLPTKE